MYLVGDIVVLNNSSITGRIIEISKNNKCVICVNDKNIITDMSNISKTDKNNQSKINSIKITFDNKSNYETANLEFIPEIMVRHQTVEEALFNVDSFIEEALYRNVKTVKIIHGKHGGILRNAVHNYLKENRNVNSYRLGNYFEGSYGVTIVSLK